jgi:hypothetical protein
MSGPEENDDYKNIKPATKHFPVSKKDVDTWYDRIEEVTSSIQEFLAEDPGEAAERMLRRERERSAAKAKQERDRNVQRYNPQYYVRFESDELINKMLEEVEKPPPPLPKYDKAHLSTFESVALREAERLKEEGNAAFKKGDLTEAHQKYSLGIAMEVVDPELVRALRNNRAQVNVQLRNWVEAADDASAVLARERHNVKALLRRATALAELFRPVEAMRDVDSILRAEPRNVECLRLREAVARELEDYNDCQAYEVRVPDDVKSIHEGIAKLTAVRGKLARIVVVDALPGDKLRLPADKDVEKVINGVVAATSELLPLFVERASATCFRFRGGLEVVLGIVRIFLAEMSGKVLSACKSAAVAMIAAERLLASSLGTELNVERCGDLSDVIKYCAEVATRPASSQRDPVNILRQLEAAACINVLEAAARSERVCDAVVAQIPAVALERLIGGTAATNGLLQPSLKLYAALLARGGRAAAERYGKLDASSASLALLASPSPALQESAVQALLRVAAQPAALQTLGAKEAVAAVAAAVCAVDSSSAAASLSPLVQEGLISVLYNIALQTEDRSALGNLLWTCCCSRAVANVFVASVRSLVYFAQIGKLDAAHWMNVAARQLALLAKFVGISSDVASLLVEVEDDVLWKTVSALALEATARAKDAVAAVAGSSHGPVSYPDQCVEHATLCLAHLFRNKLVPVDTLLQKTHQALLLSLLSAPNPIIVGNAAIILALVPAGSGHEALEAADGVKMMLASILRIRGECHAMESAGLHVSSPSVYANMKAAQKNVAVALAKCTARPSMLEQLREQNGIEILSTVM